MTQNIFIYFTWMKLKGIPSTRLLILTLVVLISFAYFRFFFKHNPKFDILQMSIQELEANHLLEKSPIVLEDAIVDPLAAVRMLFKYMYIYKSFEPRIAPNQIIRNNARYCLLFSQSDSTIVDIVHPAMYKDYKASEQGKADVGDINAPYAEVILRESRCIIIPSKWLFRVHPDSNAMAVYLEDFLSITIGRIF